MSQVLIHPTIGRVVWYYPSATKDAPAFARHADGGGPYAAVIAHVWNDHEVNLSVFDADGTPWSRPLVALIHDDNAATDAEFCMWMPFQKGQAKAQNETRIYTDGTKATGSGLLSELSPAQQDAAAEQLIQAKGMTAPRVTADDLSANIVDTEIVKHVSHSGQILRWAVLTTRSGFAVTGRPSAAVSAANDDPEIGVATAIENARNELWPLMGYELKCRLAQSAA